MLDRLFAGHLNNLERGLDRATQRQGLLMDNLANANVPGYKRRDMDFNVALNDEMGKFPNTADGQPYEDENNVRVDESSVDPEQEAVGIAQMELRFQTISDMTAGYFAGLKSAIREGR